MNMQFDGGTTVSMTMCAFTGGGRTTHVMGSKGEMWAHMDAEPGKNFHFYDFSTRSFRYLDADVAVRGDSILAGHGGGDPGIIDALHRYIRGELSAEQVSEIGISCANHLLVFAAEDSRVNGGVVDMDTYKADYMF